MDQIQQKKNIGRDTDGRENDNITNITKDVPKEDFYNDDVQEYSKAESQKRSKIKKSRSNIRKAM